MATTTSNDVQHQANPASHFTTPGAGQDSDTRECEDDLLRQLDLELDQRISRVLRLTQPPAASRGATSRVLQKSNIHRLPPRPSASRPTALPANTFRTGGVISISNGNIELQSQAVSSGEVWPAKVEPSSLITKLPEATTAKLDDNEVTRGGGVVSVPDRDGPETFSDGRTCKQHQIEEIQECKQSQIEEMQTCNKYDGENEEVKDTGNFYDIEGEEARKKMVQVVRQEEDATKVKEHESKREENNTGETGSEEDIEEHDAVFDEFLDTCTRTRIRLLTTKVTTLTLALQETKDECAGLTASKREASRAVQAGETERRGLTKRVTALQQDSARLTRTNTQLSTRVKELTSECQALQKEVSSVHQHEGKQRSTHTALQAQLTRARTESASFRDQLASLRARHKADRCTKAQHYFAPVEYSWISIYIILLKKEEVKKLRGQLEEAETRGRGLERARRNLAALTTRQQRLIEVLEKQKSNIAAGKAVAALEEKFLTTIAPLQPP